MINQVNTFKSVTNTPIATGDQNRPTISISRVRIPRIQRAYAQGREFKKETKIRNQFIDAIFKNLVENKKMDLHFIYGAVMNALPASFLEAIGNELHGDFITHAMRWWGWM